MMFSGAYDSHFYRSFRDLLHEQVDLLKPGPGMQPRQYREACAALEARWDALMAGERDHRNPRAIAVAYGKRHARDKDRKGVGKGKSVSVRVDLGGRRIIKKKQMSIPVHKQRPLIRKNNAAKK